MAETDASAPIDIQLVDKVDRKIAPEILEIAAAAREADDALLHLRAQLTGLDASKINSLSKAVQQSNLAYLNQEAALNKAVAAEQKGLAATQALETATIKKVAADLQAETALNRAVVAENAAVKSGASRAQQLIAEAKALEVAKASQAEFNRILGVGPSAGYLAGNTASASAATFQSNFRTQAANARFAYEQEVEAAKRAKKATEEVIEGHTKLGVSTLALREPFTLMREAVNGNYSRMVGSAALLAQGLNLLRFIVSPLGASIILLAAAVGTVVVAMSRGVSEVAEYNNALRATGSYAGYTYDQIESLSKSVSGNLNVSIGSAESMFKGLAQSGRVSGEELKNVGQIALKLSEMTGRSADQIAQQFSQIKGGVAEFARDFNSEFHILTAAQIDYINELERMGQKEAAEEALARQVWAGVKDAAVEQLGIIQRAIRAVKNEASEFWNYLKSIGREGTPLEKIGSDLAHIAEIKAAMKSGHSDSLGILGDAFLGGAGLQNQLDAAQKKLALDRQEMAIGKTLTEGMANYAKEQEKATESGKILSDGVHTFAKGWELANDEIKKYQDALTDAEKHMPDSKLIPKYDANRDGKLDQSVIDQIRKKYDPADVKAENEAARAAEQHSRAIDKINVALTDELERMNMLKPDRAAQAIADRYEVDMAGKKIAMSAAEKAAILEKAKAIIQAKEVQEQEDQVYNALRKPMEDYKNRLDAINLLERQNTISTREAVAQRLASAIALTEATNPLASSIADLKVENAQLLLNSDAREIETRLYQAQVSAIKAGKPVKDGEIKDLRDLLTLNQQMRQVMQAADAIYAQNAGAVKQLSIQMLALDLAYKRGDLTLEQFKIAEQQVGIEALRLKIQMGKGDFSDVLLSGLGKVIDGYKGLLPTLAQDFGNFFDSIANQAGSALGAIVTGTGDVRDEIHQAATAIESELVGALVKLGIQWLIQQAIGDSLAAAATATVSAQAAAMAAAWEPAAMAASIATFGSADAAGLDAYITAMTAGKAFTSLPGFTDGGLIGGNGSARSDSNVIRASRGEFMVNAEATAKYLPLLEMMNGGSNWLSAGQINVPGYASGGYVHSVGSKWPKIEFHNHGTPKELEVEYDEDTIRLIARDEADKRITKKVPHMLGSEIASPNTPLSKGLERHTHTKRKAGGH